MINGFTQEVAEAVDVAAEELAIAFESNLLDESDDSPPVLSAHGLSEMSEIFGAVPRTLRAAVFTGLLDVLDERGLEYDVEQFRGEVH